jgi:signal peptidase I
MSQNPGAGTAPEHSVIETLQSLIVAFVLAMIFRGFVTEGFVIPTGSMAPTLMGQHLRLHSEKTGWEFPVGVDPSWPARGGNGVEAKYLDLPDPMLGRVYPGSAISERIIPRHRMGDRILVLKSLYPFSSPSRFDVVVFKNPTDPIGPAENYIKRLVGLPDEAIWLVDGDVFATDAESVEDYSSFRIQRKPEHVQRAVWQPVHDSNFMPRDTANWDSPYHGSPWTGTTVDWDTSGPSFRCETADPSIIVWDNHILHLSDWTSYNMISPMYNAGRSMSVADIRLSATIVPDAAGLETRFVIKARQTQYEFILAGGTAAMRMRDDAWGDEFLDQGWSGTEPVEIPSFRAGVPMRIEFWHVDQAMSIFVNGKRIGRPLLYEWRPEERLQNAVERGRDARELAGRAPSGIVEMQWHFAGAPVTLHGVQVDRDLYYRTDRRHGPDRRNPSAPDFENLLDSRHPFGTHPDALAVLGPDHFFMCGDNSTASSDSRLWGNPHPLIAQQIDPHPFVVNRKLLLGKAWVVYFPAPLGVSKNGTPFVPDFGRLRFIR